MHSKSRPERLSEFIGSGSAYLQHGIDVMCDLSFRALKKAGNKPSRYTKGEKRYVTEVKRGFRGTLKFFGTLGDSYYRTYGKLKRKR